ncbi:sialidase family protein [Flavobacterium saliperosum]|uniref:BNR repeat-like domain-containing protein n=1 Tax=Flavobacterium saliperosum TaxID=329186 RepID=A0A1G4VR60_9FLAO|nr:sialidase family protein [Flavobacterium saliperosum]SCX10629.1 BNR repeat-like domain-containing protein [Flavobacterium saliperosum]
MKNKLLLVFAMLLFSLQNGNSQITETETKSIYSEGEATTVCPFFTSDTKGRMMLSFGKETKGKEAVLCYSFFNSTEKKFEIPVEVPSSRGVELHGENVPKMIVKPNGEMIAVWGIDNPTPKKKYGGLVQYSQSFDAGKSWTPATQLVKDTTGIDQRYFDIDLLPNGEVAIIWLDNRSKTDLDGSTLYYAETKGKSGFQNEKPIGETTCQCCRTDLYVGKNGVIYAAYRDIINEEIRDMVLTYSLDNGKTFSVPKRISPDDWKINGCPHTGPTMTQNTSGLHFAWFTMGGGAGVFYANSSDNGIRFSQRESVSDNPSAKHPQIATLTNDVLIVWDETTEVDGNYFNRIGLQLRSQNGKVLDTKFVTSTEGSATFPIVKALNEKEVLVAWSQGGKEEKVCYKVVRIESDGKNNSPKF